MNKIINFGFGRDFICSLADIIEAEYIRPEKDLSRLAFVFGGRRPELFLKRELASRVKKGFISPAFFAADDFIDFILGPESDFTKINDLDAAYLLYRLAKSGSPQIVKGKESFASFLPWAREILAFIEQLDLEDIQLKSLKSVELSAAIGFDVPESINALLAKVIGLRQSFHRELEQRKTLTRGMRYLKAAGKAAEKDFSEFDRIFFCNPFYLQASEKKIIKHLYSRDKAVLVFQGSSRKFSVLKDLEIEFDCDLGSVSEPPAGQEFKFFSCFDGQSQAGAVSQILRNIKDPGNTVIVLPQPEKIITLLSEIACSDTDFNVSMGYPLKRSAVFSLFSSIFKAQKSRKNSQYYTPDYLALLSHPLVKNFKILDDFSATRILVHKIEEFLTGMEKSDIGGSIFILLSRVESERQLYRQTAQLFEKTDYPLESLGLKSALRKLHELLFYSWESVVDFNDFAGKIRVFMDFLLEKSFLANYPLNLKMADRIIEIAGNLESSGFSREILAKEDIFKIFLDALSNELVSFSGSPLKGLQILGLFETRSLNFKNAIILDVNESILPDLKIYEPLIPREVMLNLGLNRLEKEEEIQRYQFERLTCAAQNVFLLFEEGKDKEKSRFIEELIWKKQKERSRLEVVSVPRASFKSEVQPKKARIEKNGKIIEYLRDFDYSVTNINTYLKCPLRFYYQYVLNLREKPDLLDEPESRQIGNFIHSLLEEAFKKFVLKKPDISCEFKKYFFDLFETMFRETFQKTMKSDSFLLKKIIRFRLERFLAEEESRPIQKILLVEGKFKEKINLSGREFNFVLKIDRIDKLNDDSLLIIDYKTGGTESKPRDIERIREFGFSRPALKRTVGSFQMPLYLYFVRRKQSEKTLFNAALYNLRESQLEYFLKPGDFSRIEDIENVFIRALEAMVLEIVDPKIDFVCDDQEPRYCQNCPFFYLCR